MPKGMYILLSDSSLGTVVIWPSDLIVYAYSVSALVPDG